MNLYQYDLEYKEDSRLLSTNVEHIVQVSNLFDHSALEFYELVQ